MTLPFDSVTYCISLEKLRNYVATVAFISNIGWKPDGFGHLLINKHSREETICIMVGKVSSSRLFTGLIGNHNPQFGQPLNKAKFQFHLTTPNEPAFIHDFNAGVVALKKAQDATQSGGESTYMIYGEGASVCIRFSSGVFVKWVSQGYIVFNVTNNDLRRRKSHIVNLLCHQRG